MKQKQKKPKETHLYKIVKDESFIPMEAVQISSVESAAEFCRRFYQDDIDIYESVFILLLNRANITIGFAKISQGGITGAVCDITLICKFVVNNLAKGVILCHNHPSGATIPSEGDKDVTRRLSKGLKLIDSKLIDHIIITKNSHYSFNENTDLI